MAGSVSISTPTVLSRDASGRAVTREAIISWVADAADGSVPTLAVTQFSGQWLTKAETNPGAVAPSAAYDITLVDGDGVDLAGGELLNRSETASEIKTKTAQIPLAGFVFTLANNVVHSATGALRLFFSSIMPVDLPDVIDGVNKIDALATLGLAGVSNSLAYRVHEIEKHFHNFERWFGKSADQSGVNPWATSLSAAAMRTAFRAISGDAAFGADANDEAQCWGLNDTLSVGGVAQAKLDFHQIFITASSVTTVWYIRIVYGTGTLADAITAGQYTEFPVVADAAQNGSIDVIIPVMMPRITIGTHKIWIQGKNATNNATIDFLIGAHGYVA